MKQTISNRVNMVNSTLGYCNANLSATSGITQFGIVLGGVSAKMVLVNSLNQIASGSSTGVTLDTNLLRSTMTSIALKCGNATLAYANATNNNSLAELVNYTESKLNRAKKEDIDDLCARIHDATAANFAAVEDYGLVAADVTDLQSSIDLYRVASQNPRQAIISKSQANEQIERIVRMVIDDLLVGQLDKMVNTLKMTNVEFWNGYYQAREIIDLGRTTAKIRGTVLDVNDTPLRGVEFSVLRAGTEALVAQGVTDLKGKFNVANLPAGMVDLRWVLAGFVTVEEADVKIVAGKELQRKVVMNKS